MSVEAGRSPVVIATRSAGKLRELRALFESAGFSVLDLDAAGIPEESAEDELEVWPTFEENALAKARWFAAKAGGRPVVADDSGLAVDALGGSPGVRSKRWSERPDLAGAELDRENNRKLLAALAGSSDRRARYVCAAAWVGDGREVVVRGETHGVLLEEPRGAEGFGYDPLFLSDDLGTTFAEATRDAKSAVSHRGRAFAALLAALERRNEGR